MTGILYAEQKSYSIKKKEKYIDPFITTSTHYSLHSIKKSLNIHKGNLISAW